MMAPARATRDRSTFGLALALAALATHALAMLVFLPRVLDDAARVIALVLLPGWAATQLLFVRRGLGRFETIALTIGLGATLAFLVSFGAHVTHVPTETADLVLAVLAVVALAPRRAAAPVPAVERSAAAAAAPAGTPAPNARTRS